MPTASKQKTILWTSGLARTYCNYVAEHNHRNRLLLLGLEASEPRWMAKLKQQLDITFISCDLTKIPTIPTHQWPQDLLDIIHQDLVVDAIIVGIRPPLLYWSHDWFCKQSQDILSGLDLLLQSIFQKNSPTNHKKCIRQVIHVSSVAAVNHLQPQIMQREGQEYTASDINNSNILIAPYDRFKRQSEIILERHCQRSSISCTHLRISAIFSDDNFCIQCSALHLQLHCAPKSMPIRIDCNSGRNVAIAIHLLLMQEQCKNERKDSNDRNSLNSGECQYYYYTRPTHHPQPLAYGQFLKHFRAAYQIPSWSIVSFPSVWMQCLVAMIHWMATETLLSRLMPFLESIDYLLQVSSREHTFDNTLFKTDFPQLSRMEESIPECFVRRRRFLGQQ